MSKEKAKGDIQSHKDTVLTSLSSFLDSLIQSEDPKDSKRADLVSYWLKDFQHYLAQEKTFDAVRIKAYKRGDVVKVNLGFNVGSEQGGLRYAIVLDKDNKHNSKTITVIPLTSQKEQKNIYERDINLGRELYNRLKAKYDSASEELNEKRIRCNAETDRIHKVLSVISKIIKIQGDADGNFRKMSEDFQEMLANQTVILDQLNNEAIALDKIRMELHKMKDGSIAKIEQITTISKQRIFDPKKSADVLAGISFSDAAMDKINEKIKELYIF